MDLINVRTGVKMTTLTDDFAQILIESGSFVEDKPVAKKAPAKKAAPRKATSNGRTQNKPTQEVAK